MLFGTHIFREQYVADLFMSTHMEPSFHFQWLLLLQEEYTMAYGSATLFSKIQYYKLCGYRVFVPSSLPPCSFNNAEKI